MKIKPKDVQVNLPCHFEFKDEDECAQMAANINSVLHGRSRVKYDIMGTRGDMVVGLLYLERWGEYLEYREFLAEFVVDPPEAPPTPKLEEPEEEND